MGVRYICAMEHPDHDTICKFRRENAALVSSVFTQTLHLAGEAGILRLGALELGMDGTKIKANTSSQPKRVEAVEREIELLEARTREYEQRVAELLEQAEAKDREEEKCRSPLPEELADGERRREKLKALRKSLAKQEARRAALAAAKAKFGEKKKARAEKAKKRKEEIEASEIGTPPRQPKAEVEDSDEINLADPDATKVKNYRGYQQGYNAQGLVSMDESRLLVGVRVSREENDRREMRENLAEVESHLGKGAVRVVVSDSGYDNTWEVAEIEKNGGPEMLCEQQGRKKKNGEPAPESYRLTERKRKTREKRDELYRRLREPESRELRKKRSTTIEPVFGYIKEALGFRQFSMRGIEKVGIEWRLVALAYNFNRLTRKPEWVEMLR